MNDVAHRQRTLCHASRLDDALVVMKEAIQANRADVLVK
jgi:hypothetical protein